MNIYNKLREVILGLMTLVAGTRRMLNNTLLY